MTSLVKNNHSNQKAQPRYNPFDRFFRNDLIDLFGNGDSIETVPSMNITEEKDGYKVEMAAPGLKKDDFNISVEGDLMTISSEKETETKEPKNGNNYSRREYNYSSFSRAFTLPENADTDRVAAKYTDGVLKLTIPKKPEASKAKGQKIKVE